MENYNLDFITCDNDKEMIQNAIISISQLYLWSWLREHEGSFMFDNSSNITRIVRKMEENGYSGHSGTSFAITMTNMKYIARNGYDQWKATRIELMNERRERTPVSNRIPSQ